MTIFLDTNIVLDVLLKRELFYEDSLSVLNLCQSGKHKGWLNIISIANIFYIGSKVTSKKQAKEVIETLVSYLYINGGNTETVKNALKSEFNDFEDALQNFSAEEQGQIQAIISRNTKDYNNNSLPVFSPTEFLRIHFQ